MSSHISILISEGYVPHRHDHIRYRYCHLLNIDTVIFHVDTVSLRSHSTSMLSSCHPVDRMTISYHVTLGIRRTLAAAAPMPEYHGGHGKSAPIGA
jgi:hypothetical protein